MAGKTETVVARGQGMSNELTDEELDKVFRDSYELIDSRLTLRDRKFARAVIAADRAKRVTMTHAQRVDVLAEFGAGDMWDFFDGIRAAEAFHGIGSKT